MPYKTQEFVLIKKCHLNILSATTLISVSTQHAARVFVCCSVYVDVAMVTNTTSYIIGYLIILQCVDITLTSHALCSVLY